VKRSPLAQGSKGLTRSGFVRQQQALARATGLHPAGNGLSRGKPLAQRSPERIAEDDGPWQETKRLVDERDGGVCQIRRFFPAHRCSFGCHRHHVTPKKHGGDRLAVDNVATVCLSGHDWIHNGIGWQAFRDAWEARDG
jgi:hypothetical protein